MKRIGGNLAIAQAVAKLQLCKKLSPACSDAVAADTLKSDPIKPHIDEESEGGFDSEQ